MTKDRKRKQEIREYAAAKGLPFMQAQRELETLRKKPEVPAPPQLEVDRVGA